MKITYTCSTVIDKPRTMVTAYLLNHSVMLKWQPNLKRVERTSNPLITYLVYDDNTKEFVLTETIKDNHLPDYVTIKYTALHIINICTHTFIDLINKTEWIMDAEFVFESTPPSSKDTYINQTKEAMERFKTYIENIT